MRGLSQTIAEFDPELPLDHARTIPASWYTSAEVYALEREAVFGDSWLVAGRLDAVTEPGAFRTLEIAGEPILVVRGDDGVLRAFSNVCRHRAAPLLTDCEGRASKLRCRYHGWTYDLCGRLRGTPEFDGVADFRREDNGLIEWKVATWGPLVFVHQGSGRCTPPEPEPLGAHVSRAAHELNDFLDPFSVRVGSLDGLRFVERRSYELACNWKVFVDNYLDGGYHINTVHPGLAGVLDYTHYRTEVFAHASVQTSPLKPSGDAVGAVRTGALAQYWWVWPNLMLNLYDGVMDTNLVLPLGPDRCRVLIDFYFARTEGDEANHYVRDSIEVGHLIQLEDVGICEEVQRGLGSRSFHTGRFSVRREAAGYHFHQLLGNRLREAIRGASP